MTLPKEAHISPFCFLQYKNFHTLNRAKTQADNYIVPNPNLNFTSEKRPVDTANFSFSGALWSNYYFGLGLGLGLALAFGLESHSLQ